MRGVPHALGGLYSQAYCIGSNNHVIMTLGRSIGGVTGRQNNYNPKFMDEIPFRGLLSLGHFELCRFRVDKVSII